MSSSLALAGSPPSSSTSPPRTPVGNQARASSTPSSDDSSIIDDLSFEYVFDDKGNYVRLSKGSSSKSNASSPPTPQDSLPEPIDSKRSSLSRSESLRAPSTDGPPARSFQRVASGPALSITKPRPLPRRVTLEDSNHNANANKQHRPKHEKENNFLLSDSDSPQENVISKRSAPLTRAASYSRPLLTDAHQRQILPGPNRAGRIMKTAATSAPVKFDSGFDKIAETIPDDLPPDHPYETDLEGDLPPLPPPSSTPFPSSDGDTEVIEPASIPLPSSIPSTSGPAATSKQRSYAALPTSTRDSSSKEPPNALVLSTGTRPRRSASLSDALSLHAHQHQQRGEKEQQLREQYQNLRSGTTANDNTGGPRRVTLEEREREERDIRIEYKRYRREAEEVERRQSEQDQYYDQQHYNAPGPTSSQQQQQPSQSSYNPNIPLPPSIRTTTSTSSTSSASSYGHRRRDSDTLRSMPMPLSAGPLSSPTVLEMPPRASALAVGRVSPPGARLGIGRTSPPAAGRVGRVSPPGARIARTSGGERERERASPLERERISPPPPVSRVSSAAPNGNSGGRTSPRSVNGIGGRTSPKDMGRVSPAPASGLRVSPPGGVPTAKHRRSPTAPETVLSGGDEYAVGIMEGRRQMQMQDQHRQQQYVQPPQQQQVQQQQVQAPAAQLNRHMVVNKKAYARLDMIGKGGSSRVFRVLNHANELYAIKRVSLDKTDSETMSGYMNEIALLKRLEGNSRIIRLIDSEVKTGPGGSKGHLLLVMECGEVDLARLIAERSGEGLDMVWVAYYWQQMLQAVHVIHEEKIVHSDLKPANFVLVRGQLKLIDFGIANAIANDTTNIQRDHQIGTVNYMSPEAIELPDGMRRLKVGRPSDVWSLGCILYQMIYGYPPFQHLSVYQKMKAIPDLGHVIEFPEYSVPVAKGGGSASGGEAATPPKRLEHLKKRVRRDVVESMKSCLCRGPKERATIPELLEQDWLAMKEPEPPAVKQMLAPDETVINPYYMRQLLQYGIKLGEAQSSDMSPEALLREAERLVAELKSIQP